VAVFHVAADLGDSRQRANRLPVSGANRGVAAERELGQQQGHAERRQRIELHRRRGERGQDPGRADRGPQSRGGRDLVTQRPSERAGAPARPDTGGDDDVHDRDQCDDGDHQQRNPAQFLLEHREPHGAERVWRCGAKDDGRECCGNNATGDERQSRTPPGERLNSRAEKATERNDGHHLCGRLRDRRPSDVEEHRVTDRGRERDRCGRPVPGQSHLQQFTKRDESNERDDDVCADDAIVQGQCGRRAGADAYDEDEGTTGGRRPRRVSVVTGQREHRQETSACTATGW
jgi:hypothetical protein